MLHTFQENLENYCDYLFKSFFIWYLSFIFARDTIKNYSILKMKYNFLLSLNM